MLQPFFREACFPDSAASCGGAKARASSRTPYRTHESEPSTAMEPSRISRMNPNVKGDRTSIVTRSAEHRRGMRRSYGVRVLFRASREPGHTGASNTSWAAPPHLAGPPRTQLCTGWFGKGQEFLFFRARVTARPASPMPSNAIEAGSGTGATSTIPIMLPPSCGKAAQYPAAEG